MFKLCCHFCFVQLFVVIPFGLGRWNIANRFKQAAIVEPVDPFQRGEFYRCTEFIAAMLLAAIFFTFLIQIFSRYASKIAWMVPIPPISNWMAAMEPVGWTVNLISFLWVWAVFFCCSFIVRERDQVTFDIIYIAVPTGAKKVLAILTAVLMLAAILYSFPYVYETLFSSRLMEIKKVQSLRMPFTGDKIAMKWLFASLLLLMIVVGLRYVWRMYTVIRFGPPEIDPDEFSSNDDQSKEVVWFF